MEKVTPYIEAKVLLAAIVILEYRGKKSPDVKMISELTTFSVEKVYSIVKKLENLGAVKRIAGPFDDNVVIKDESLLEELREEEFSANIEDEVADFAEKQKSKFADIDSLFGSGDKKQDLKQSLEEQIKAGGKVKKENPLDIFSTKKDKPKPE